MRGPLNYADWLAGQVLQKLKYSFGPYLFFLVIGSIFCWVLTNIAIETYRINSRPQVECRIIDTSLTVTTDRRGDPSYSLRVRYRYSFAGLDYESTGISRHDWPDGRAVYRHKDQADAAVQKYAPGATRQCYVDPRQPDSAILERSTSDYWVMAFLPIPLALALYGLLHILAIWAFVGDNVSFSQDIGRTLHGKRNSSLLLTVAGIIAFVVVATAVGVLAAFAIAFLAFAAFAFISAVYHGVRAWFTSSRRDLLQYQVSADEPGDDVPALGSLPVRPKPTRIVLSAGERRLILKLLIAFVCLDAVWVWQALRRASQKGQGSDCIPQILFGTVVIALMTTVAAVGMIVDGRKNMLSWLREEQESGIGPARIRLRQVATDPAVWCLLVANCLALVQAIVQKWPLVNIMWVYWFQSVGIGLIWFVRLWTIRDFTVARDTRLLGNPNQPFGRAVNAIFFLCHYGVFHIVYMLFLTQHGGSVAWGSVCLMGSAFFAAQVFSFARDKKIVDRRQVEYGKLIFMPYARIIPMHLTMLGAAMLKDKYGIDFGHIVVLMLFMVLKTVADVLMHLNEQRVFTKVTPAAKLRTAEPDSMP